jgi:hypothetical protein
MAVAGLAKAIDDSIGSQYLAGLWRNDLELQPAWKVLDPNRDLQWKTPNSGAHRGHGRLLTGRSP